MKELKELISSFKSKSIEEQKQVIAALKSLPKKSKLERDCLETLINIFNAQPVQEFNIGDKVSMTELGLGSFGLKFFGAELEVEEVRLSGNGKFYIYHVGTGTGLNASCINGEIKKA